MSSSKPKTVSGTASERSSDLINKSGGASLLILVQFLTKFLTFTLNQVLIRFISPKIFGISTYLEFLVSTVLFFSREGARLSVQRTETADTDAKQDDEYSVTSIKGVHQSIVNFGFIPLIIGVPLSVAIFYWQYRSTMFQESILTLPYHHATIALIWVSIVIELSAEPIYALNQFQLNFKTRSKFEGYAVFLRCVVTVGAVILSKKFSPVHFDGIAVMAFALGQFAYSSTLSIAYHVNFAAHPSLKYSIEKIHSGNTYFYFNSKILSIWKSLFIQMLFKQFLTEGDKLLINYLCTVEEQGVYSVVTNYGSMAARLIFQPIEESVRLLFTRLLSSKSKPSSKDIHDSFKVMKNLSLFYLNFSILIVLAGVTNASFLLSILLGSKSPTWANTNIFEVFPRYVLYLPLLAFNGIFEAFFTSIATTKDIKAFSLFMSFSSIVVLVSSYIFIDYYQLGLSGLILSNSINMLMRIAYSCASVKSFFNRNGVRIAALGVVVYIVRPIGIAVLFQSAYVATTGSWYTQNFKQFFQSFVTCVLCLGGLGFVERDLLRRQMTPLAQKLKRKTQ